MHFMMTSTPAQLAAVTTSRVEGQDDELQDDQRACIQWAQVDSGGKAMFTRLADWGECCVKQSARRYSLNLLFGEAERTTRIDPQA